MKFELFELQRVRISLASIKKKNKNLKLSGVMQKTGEEIVDSDENELENTVKTLQGRQALRARLAASSRVVDSPESSW